MAGICEACMKLQKEYSEALRIYADALQAHTNLIVQREMNTLGVRQIVPTGPHEFIMKWTMFGFEGDDEEMTRHRLRQGNMMGPAGFLGLEDNEAIKFVQDGMQRVPNQEHLVKLDPSTAAGTSDTLISEAAIRAMYRHWRQEMGL